MSDIMAMDLNDDALIHYGVKGMKWGVTRTKEQKRADKLAKREKKAQKYDAKADMLGTKISTLQSQNLRGLARLHRDAEVRDLKVLESQARADAQRKREGKLTDQQRKMAIGAAVAGTAITAAAVYGGMQSGEFNRLSMKGKAKLEGKEFEFKKDSSLSRSDMSLDEIQNQIVSQINPEYGAIGTKQNCRRATFAYEMRRRGYDVTATKTTNAYGQNVLGLENALSPGERKRATGKLGAIGELTYEAIRKEKGGKSSTLDMVSNQPAGGKNKIDPDGMDFLGVGVTPKKIFADLSAQPNGSRGELAVGWKMGGGHSVAYEIIGGKLSIFDTQSGKTFNSPDDMFREYPGISTAGFTRLDNANLNEDFLMRWVKNND